MIMNIHDMLIAYQASNQKRLLEVHQRYGDPSLPPIKQVVEPPVPLSNFGVPTLQSGHYKPMTPMLATRFEFAGAWKEADAGHDWLSIQEMEAASLDANIREQISIRKETWDESPINLVPPSRISLFGIYRDQSEEIYLVWPAAVESEPEILSYAGNFESKFANFGHYLRHLIDGCVKSGSP